MLTGGTLQATLVLLALWFVALCVVAWKLLRPVALGLEPTTRSRLTIAGIWFSATAVGVLFLLHLSWISPGVSQRLGAATVGILSSLLFWSTLAGLVLSAVGLGKIRIFGIATCLATGYWWLSLAASAAISLGPEIVRHATSFLIPDGYIGWVEIKYDQSNEPALKIVSGKYICRIPASGFLQTSSPLEGGWARDEYFYYAEDGSTHALINTGRGSGGMIWAGATQFLDQTTDGSLSKEAKVQFFFVGTEEQYRQATPFYEGHPVNESKSSKNAP